MSEPKIETLLFYPILRAILAGFDLVDQNLKVFLRVKSREICFRVVNIESNGFSRLVVDILSFNIVVNEGTR